MRITHLGAECMPFAKTGGLGDVVAALPKALAARGHDTDVWLPFYLQAEAWYRARHLWPELALEPFVVEILGQRYPVAVLRGTLPDSAVPVFFVVQDQFFRRAQVYGHDEQGHDDGLWRFAVFVRAALEGMKRLGRRPHVLHGHDWHAALAPMLGAWSSWREPWFDDVASVFTIHNLAYQGSYPSDLFPALGLPAEAWGPGGVEFHGAVNLLKGAIVAADVVTTVSPTYAREIRTPAGGCDLDAVLRGRGERVVGILNGIDPKEWSPATDARLPARYDVDDLRGKALCREALCREAGLDAGDPGLILGTVGRLAHQKGYDVFLAAAPLLLAGGVRVVMVGSGDPALEAEMRRLERAAPGRFAAWVGHDEGRAHLVEAGADAFMMPSRFEPCGLNQMYSLAYGTPPIVRRTGGLADTVVGYDGANLDDADGFSFDELTVAAIQGTVATADQVFRGPRWSALVRNGMRRDFSWNRSATHYEQVYRHARALRGLAVP